MGEATNGELKRRKRKSDWKGDDLEVTAIQREDQQTKKRHVRSKSDEDEMLYGGLSGLTEARNKEEDEERIDFDDLRKISRQRYLSGREKRKMYILEEEMKQFEEDIGKVGWNGLTTKEQEEYKIKKEIIEIYHRRSDLEEHRGEGFMLQDDYLDEEGRIDSEKKKEVFLGRNKHDEIIDRNEKSIKTGFTHMKPVEESKQYDYVFDKSQEVKFSSDNESEPVNEMEEQIKREEQRVKSIAETRKSLPIFQYRDQLIDAIKMYPVLIVVGETGSGKTTQLPQYLYEAGLSKKLGETKFDHERKIGCTQPRRVAATSVARRVAEEIGARVGGKVGYAVRFDDQTSDDTVIKYMTDGMLVREFMSDPELSDYSVMMVDEAHERTLHTDIALGLLKDISVQRSKDFRLIVSSATMDAEKFSSYFNDAPIFNVPGRRFPVSIHYTMQPEANYLHAATTTVFQIHLSQGPGDILVFLTGQDEIETMASNLRETCDKLKGQMDMQMVVCPIYANLPAEKQKLIFAPTPKNCRKVVLATNIAETSLTIDGIVYVIDTGFVKEDQFSSVTGMQSLTVVPCSRASADQRAGRAGRTGPGKCFRLYTKWSYMNEMPANPTPEILRANLSGVVLQMTSLGITDLVHFDFLDPPSAESLIKALEQLYSLGALNENGELTSIGQKMADLPCDPMLARSLITSGQLHCCQEVVSVAAMLDESNALFYRKKDGVSPEQRFQNRGQSGLWGDQLTLLEIWNEFADSGFSRLWCKDNSIQFRTLNRARSIHNQLERLCRRLGLSEDEKPMNELDDDEKDRLRVRVMRSFASGFFANAAKLNRTGDCYRTLKKHQTVWIHPSSALFSMKPPPKTIIYNELVLTSKEFMRNCMPVTEKWLREYGEHYYNSGTKSNEH